MTIRRLFVAGLCLILAALAAAAAPAIEVDRTSIAVAVWSGQEIAEVFTLSNAGDSRLSIGHVLTSCGCTTAALATKRLAPGESVALNVKVDTRGMSGSVLRTVDVQSDDPEDPSLTLRILIYAIDPALLVAALPPESPASFVLLDVRTAEEFAAGHLLGAQHLPLSELERESAVWSGSVPRGVPLVVYCQAGARSARAVELLRAAGFTAAYNLLGGVAEWTRTFGSGGLRTP